VAYQIWFPPSDPMPPPITECTSNSCPYRIRAATWWVTLSLRPF